MAKDPLKTFKERLRQAIPQSAEKFEEITNGRFKTRSIRRWKNEAGATPSVAELIALAGETGKSPDWFFGDDQPPDPSLVAIRRFETEAEAGHGAIGGEVEEVEDTLWPADLLSRLGLDARKTHILRARGDSMEPGIQSGAMLFVEKVRRDHALKNGDIYVVRDNDNGGTTRVKRVFLADGGRILVSDNSAYQPEYRKGDKAELRGKVLCWLNPPPGSLSRR